MLNGGLAKKLLVFALPLAASSILQQLFNSVDVAVVGKFDTSTGQAAVGCNAPVINLLINLFGGLSIGANVVISTYIGYCSHSNGNLYDKRSLTVVSWNDFCKTGAGVDGYSDRHFKSGSHLPKNLFYWYAFRYGL